MGRRGRALEVMDQAYRLDLDDASWLRAVTDAIEPFLEPETGTVAYFFDLVGPRTELAHVYARNAELDVPLQQMPVFDEPAQRAAMMQVKPVSTISEMLAPGLYERWVATSGRAMHIVDSLGVTALNPDGTGLVMSSGALHRVALTPQRRATLGRLAAHVGTAFRLRRRLSGCRGLDDAEAVLTAEGRVEHARRTASLPHAQAALRRAALAADRARARTLHGDDAALEAWKGLVVGRWSIVDRFDTDGRRFWVAHRNAPDAPDPRGLSPAERRVVTYAAMGRSQKEIAYALGLSLGTVGDHLRAGLRKLGLTRLELVRLFSPLWLRRASRGRRS